MISHRSNHPQFKWKTRELFSYTYRCASVGRCLWVVFNWWADSFPAAPLTSVNNTRSVRLVAFLHSRVPVILDRIVRSEKGWMEKENGNKQSETSSE